jgi:hypothetical protein
LEHRKFVRQEHAKQDLQQTVFFQEESKEIDFKGNPNKYAKLTEKGVDPFRNTTCPFCLGYNRLRLFLVSTKKGYDRGKGKCPLCGQGAKLQTLVKMETWGPEEYAQFVFDYRSSGFWQKIKFHEWKKRLTLMCWTEQFWNEYRRLRGDAPDAEREKELEEKWKTYEEPYQP